MEVKGAASLDHIQLPPGFRFHPSDEELLVHYLKKKVTSNPLPASIVAEIDLYKHNPWELPKKALFGEDEWYFFTPRDRKYPNGARPNRAAASGYWKATGTDKPILTSCGTTSIGVKKALVFYKGRPPNGTKTDWIMHEYRLLDTMMWNNPKRKGSMRLDDWVLCRVRQKSSITRNSWEDQSGPSYEPDGYFQKVNELLLQTNTNPNNEMVKNYLYNDCPMLPYIFASQDFPCMKTDSNMSFQSSENSCTSVYGDNNSDDKTNLQFSSVTSLDDLFLSPKRKLGERNQQERFVQSSKKLTTKEDIEKENVVMSTSNVVKYCGTDQCENSNFRISPAQWNSLLQYQELNHLAFTGNDH